MPTEDRFVEDDELDLRVYLDLLRRRWKLIAIAVVVTVVAAVAFTVVEEPKYRASSDLLIEQNQSYVPDAGSPNVQQSERLLNNEERVFESQNVRSAVEEAYDGPLDVRSVGASTSAGTSDVLSTSVTAADPAEAEELLALYVETFIEVRRSDRLAQLLAVADEIETELADLNQRIAEARAPLDQVNAQLATDPDNEELLAQRAQLEDELAGQLNPLLRQQSTFETQLDELSVTTGITELGNVSILNEAEATDSPVSPKPARNVAVALVVGLILGVGLAFARESLDTRIRGRADVEELTGGRPLLAEIPLHPRHKEPDFVATLGDSKSVQAEAYRTLRTAIRFAGIDRPLKVIQITSPHQGEGKSTLAANLAVAFAQAGDRVLLVCTDLRRPRVQERFSFPLEPGFTDVLVGDAQPGEVINRHADLSLSVLTAGSPPPNPSELLSSTQAETVIASASERFDVVIIDSTPVIPVTDAVVVSRMADATVVIADARNTSRDDLATTVRQLDQAHAPVFGVVLNGTGSASYGYGYGYNEVPSKARKGRERVEGPV